MFFISDTIEFKRRKGSKNKKSKKTVNEDLKLGFRGLSAVNTSSREARGWITSINKIPKAINTIKSFFGN